jgi:DNA-binding CsgD family transcriptional regulator
LPTAAGRLDFVDPTKVAVARAGHGDSHNDAVATESELRLRIGARDCRLVCIDSVVPMHLDGGSLRPRLVYTPGEVVHFDLDGHRWAIVPEQPVHAARADAASDIHALLTNRELQIVQLICLGYLTKQVADRLHLSEFTVRSYLKAVYCKLGVRSRGAMVFRYAQAFSRAAAKEGVE